MIYPIVTSFLQIFYLFILQVLAARRSPLICRRNSAPAILAQVCYFSDSRLRAAAQPSCCAIITAARNLTYAAEIIALSNDCSVQVLLCTIRIAAATSNHCTFLAQLLAMITKHFILNEVHGSSLLIHPHSLTSPLSSSVPPGPSLPVPVPVPLSLCRTQSQVN